jgi:hypothetical protein
MILHFNSGLNTIKMDDDFYINHNKKDENGNSIFILKPNKLNKSCYNCAYVGVISPIHNKCYGYSKWKAFKHEKE